MSKSYFFADGWEHCKGQVGQVLSAKCICLKQVPAQISDSRSSFFLPPESDIIYCPAVDYI